ncbi:hypothetical protein JTB14_027053 [Gonioctena quinquepunctata]|nr:hypothetical protein JTB14_027053 [Gonioctena quinquepunctata]
MSDSENEMSIMALMDRPGEPASLREETHPDWVPSINMGYEINHGNSHVCDRYKRLQVFHMDKLDMVVC